MHLVFCVRLSTQIHINLHSSVGFALALNCYFGPWKRNRKKRKIIMMYLKAWKLLLWKWKGFCDFRLYQFISVSKKLKRFFTALLLLLLLLPLLLLSHWEFLCIFFSFVYFSDDFNTIRVIWKHREGFNRVMWFHFEVFFFFYKGVVKLAFELLLLQHLLQSKVTGRTIYLFVGNSLRCGVCFRHFSGLPLHEMSTIR